MPCGSGQKPEEDADREQRQARHQHAGDRASAESDGQAALQRSAGRFGGADIGAHGNVHADEACRAGQDGANQKTDCRCRAQEEEDDRRNHNPDHADGHILAAEIGLCPFLDRPRDRLHGFIAGGGRQYLTTGYQAVEQG